MLIVRTTRYYFTPAEKAKLVFAVPPEEIGPVVGRTFSKDVIVTPGEFAEFNRVIQMHSIT